MLGHSSNTSIITHQLTCPLETVYVLLLDLVVALAKFLLVLFFSLEDTPSGPILFHNSPL